MEGHGHFGWRASSFIGLKSLTRHFDLQLQQLLICLFQAVLRFKSSRYQEYSVAIVVFLEVECSEMI